MWNDYQTFLDYLELRRQVEKRLARPARAAAHVTIFALVTTLAGILGSMTSRWPYGQWYFVAPEAGYVMAVWSLLLLLHTGVAYWSSGLNVFRRGQAIEKEMRKRLASDDTYLGADPADLFELHSRLHADVGLRASALPLYLVLTTLNALVWLMFATQGAFTNFAWIGVPMLALMFTPFIVRKNRQIARHERSLIERVTPVAKRKRHHEAAYRLAEDGELVEIDIAPAKSKRLAEDA